MNRNRPRSWTADELAGTLTAALAGLDEMFPVTVDQHDEWGVTARVFVARMAGTMLSIAALAPSGRVGDAVTLARSVVEHAITLCWLAIAPDENLHKWHGDAARREASRQERAAHFGIEHYNADGIASMRRLPLIRLEQRATEADAFWAGQVGGWNDGHNPGHAALRSLRGVYDVVYRTASAHSHPQPESFSEGILKLAEHGGPHLVRMEQEGDFSLAAHCLPPYSLAVVVAQRTTGWPGTAIAGEHERRLRQAAARRNTA